MKTNWKTVIVSGFVAAVLSFTAAEAARTNYIGTIFVADATTPTHQLTVNADGSINIVCH